MSMSSSRGWLTAGLVAAVVLLACGPSHAQELRLAISGYDPVAYFTDGRPVPGLSRFEYVWHDARWRFASQPHLDAFSEEPNRYAHNTTDIARLVSPSKKATRTPSTPRRGPSSTASSI